MSVYDEIWQERTREFNEADIHERPVDLEALRTELIQTAAMAAAWADACRPQPTDQEAGQ